jgi:hypothetical protein
MNMGGISVEGSCSVRDLAGKWQFLVNSARLAEHLETSKKVGRVPGTGTGLLGSIADCEAIPFHMLSIPLIL